jgi:hypothetical protein
MSRQTAGKPSKILKIYVFRVSVVASKNGSYWAPPKGAVLKARGVASGDTKAIRSGMPDRFKGHALVGDTNLYLI